MVAAPDEPFWRPYMEYFGLSVLTRTDDITAYGWDRRRLSLAAFMRLAARRELSGESGPPPAALLLPPPLDRAAFADAVRAALRDLHRPDRLGASPLTGTALGPDVREHLVAAVGRVGEEPKGEVLRRVLDRTYLRPAPSQEAAAEVLGLPFSTYRRHLGRAVERVVELLWAVETGQEVSNVRSGRVSTGARAPCPLCRDILVLGSGLTGLTTAMLLARDGHAVTVLERDPAPPPDGADAAWAGVGAARRRPVPAAALPAAPVAGGDGRRSCPRCSRRCWPRARAAPIRCTSGPPRSPAGGGRATSGSTR